MKEQNDNRIKKSAQSISILKCFACICVIFIHVQFPELMGQILVKCSRFAVPCFFMISGYFAFGCNSVIIKQRLFKISRLFGFAFLVWLIVYLYFHFIDGDYSEWLNSIFVLENFQRLIFLCDTNFAYVLWYLVAMIQTYTIWYFVVAKNKENEFLKLLFILFPLQFIFCSYVLTNKLDWHLEYNTLTAALPWFLLGYYIHLNQQKFIKIKNSKLLLSAIIGCLVSLIPVVFYTSIDLSHISVFLYSASLFIIAVKSVRINFTNAILNVLAYIGYKLSLKIYILHVLIAEFIYRAKPHVNLNFKPLIVIFLTILIAYIMDLLKTNIKLSGLVTPDN